MKYRCVWFDLGLTLVQRPVAASYQQVLAAFGAARGQQQIERAFYLADKTFMREYPHVLGGDGAAYFAWYLGLVNYHLGLQLDLERCCTLFRAVRAQSDTPWQPIPGAKELLAALHRAGVGTGLLSNWDNSCRTVLRHTGLAELLDTVTISCEVGVESRMPPFFMRLCSRQGMTPVRCCLWGTITMTTWWARRRSASTACCWPPTAGLGWRRSITLTPCRGLRTSRAP